MLLINDMGLGIHLHLLMIEIHLTAIKGMGVVGIVVMLVVGGLLLLEIVRLLGQLVRVMLVLQGRILPQQVKVF